MYSSRTRAWRRAQRDRYLAKRQQQIHVLQQRRSARYSRDDDTDIAIEAGRFAKASFTCLPHKYGFHTFDQTIKPWKLLWSRSQKLSRAKQLKTFYPQKFWALEVAEAIDVRAESAMSIL